MAFRGGDPLPVTLGVRSRGQRAARGEEAGAREEPGERREGPEKRMKI
jgi:hypothetical protein